MNWYKESMGKYDHVPEKHKHGNCFDQAFEYIFQEGIIKGNNNLQIVHAIIQPLLGPLSGIEFGHAWVEDGDKVIDTSRNNEVMDKQSYYVLGGLMDMWNNKVKEEKIHRYSVEDAKKMAVQKKTAGPWEDKFDEFVLENEEEDGINQY